MRPPHQTPPSRGTGRTRTHAVLVAVVAAALAGSGLIALGASGDAAPSPGPAAVRAPDTAAPAPGAGSGQPLQDATALEPLLTAPPVHWRLFAGVPLPYSATAGPRLVDGPVYAGFERSQTGALLAAAHLGTRYLLTPSPAWRDVVTRQVLPGPGRDAYVRLRAGVDDAGSPGGHGQPAGFRFLAFTPGVAVVQEAIRFPRSGVLQVTSTTLRWVGGDWRLQLQPDGSTSPTAQQVPDLDGFVVWGP
jgi:hypothetical protein